MRARLPVCVRARVRIASRAPPPARRRRGSQVYVQHKVLEDGPELWGMLQANGHVYVCGGTSMGRDVVGALQEAVGQHGGMGRDAAAAYIKEMQASGRLVQELWS